MLLSLLALQVLLLLFATGEEVVFLTLAVGEFLLGLLDVLLYQHNGLALRPLVLGILTGEAQTAVHLREVLGTEDKHQLVL